MLANVLFYLDGAPLAWFQTHEEEISSWDLFKEKLRDLFGNPFGRQLNAKKALATRVQTSTESYVSYILDVLALCAKADPNMSEDDKVNHVLKGIADDAFNLLVFTNVTSIDAILKECRRLEHAKSRRVSQHITRLPNTAATSSCDDLFHQPSRCDNLTRIIRREVEAAQPAAPSFPSPDHSPATISLIQAVVRQELSNVGLHSVRSVRSEPPSYRTNQPRSSHSSYGQRNPSEWRTVDDKPICFNCRRIGHIARHCRSRWTSPTRFSSAYYPRPSSASFSFAPSMPDPSSDPATPLTRPRYSRSPSPSRRQSRSPPSRRAPSPTYSPHPRPEN